MGDKSYLQPLAKFLVELPPRIRWKVGALRTAVVRPAFAHIGKKSVIMRPERTGGARSIWIGDGTVVYEDSWLQAEQPDGRLVVGDNVYLGRRVHLHAAGTVVIGDNCYITDEVVISDGEHDRIHPELVSSVGDIKVGAGVFIGNGAMILGGVTVGDGARVAARAVVTRDVPAGATVAGVPARVISGA
jgi:acetyltransferase-like isoleucine patch superfamily enzyme